jgi:hypothetical protein
MLPIHQATSRHIAENNRLYIVRCKNSEYDGMTTNVMASTLHRPISVSERFAENVTCITEMQNA